MNQRNVHILSATIRFLSELIYLLRVMSAVMHPSGIIFPFALEVFPPFSMNLCLVC